MSNIIPVTNKETGITQYLHIPEDKPHYILEEIFSSDRTFDIEGAVIDMGFNCADFPFVIKWIEILMNHPYPNVRRNTQLALGYFCQFQQILPDPERIVNALIKGLFDPYWWCYYDVEKDVKGYIFMGRVYERKIFRRGVTTLKVIHLLSHLPPYNSISLKSHTFICIKHKESSASIHWFHHHVYVGFTLPIKETKRKGEIRHYDLDHLWDGPSDIIPHDFLRIIQEGSIQEAVKQIILNSWYQEDFDLFIKAVRIAFKRTEAILHICTIRAVWDYMVVFRKFYENEALFEVLNEFIASCNPTPPEPLPPDSDEIKKAYPNPCTRPSISSIEYYEHEDLRTLAIEQIERMRDFIIYATVGYDDDE